MLQRSLVRVSYEERHGPGECSHITHMFTLCFVHAETSLICDTYCLSWRARSYGCVHAVSPAAALPLHAPYTACPARGVRGQPDRQLSHHR